MNTSPAIIAVCGTGQAIQGAYDIATGKMQKGVLKTISGLSHLSAVAMRWLKGHGDLMKPALSLGACAVTSKGVIKVIEGVRDGDLINTLHGTLQTSAGLSAVIVLNCLDSKIIAVAQQSLLFGFSFGYTSLMGIQKIAIGDYKKGCLELFIGGTGILCSGYYFYHEVIGSSLTTTLVSKEVPPKINSFLKAHEFEVIDMYTTKNVWGRFCINA